VTDRQTDRRTDRQTSAPFHDMATHSGPHNKMWRKTIFNMADRILTPYNVACGSGIVTANLLSDSTLQCDTWLWDEPVVRGASNLALRALSPDGATSPSRLFGPSVR